MRSPQRRSSEARINGAVLVDSSSSASLDGVPPAREEETVRQRVRTRSNEHVELVEQAEQANGTKTFTSRLTLKYEELMPWQMDNFYIRTGYRRLQNSYMGCMRSLFYLHNETGNILSHFLGALGFVASFFVTYAYAIEGVDTATYGDQTVIAVFLFSAVACLGLSAFFHTCICHSQDVCIMWNKADYVGIVLLICGSTVPTIYYAFYCHDTLKRMYLAMTTLFGVLTLFMCLSSRFSTPEYRFIRTGNFSALGLSGVLPLLHSINLYGFNFVSGSLAFWNLVIMAALYLAGAGIYASRIPERWYPGRFDIWGHSHQIFHILVVSAATVHYFGVMSDFRFWHAENPHCSVPTDQLIARFSN
ncbi:hypothetical protein SpCBS45565_g04143 [Spizellomyces sp. 'palustris']|nr:hypothetical protein SpCBS45565_g04143 [Spizellomyces sp. 'palustris']